MDIWRNGQSNFMFPAFKGRKFAKDFDKLKAQNEYRRNQITNERAGQTLGAGSTKTRRHRKRIQLDASICYAAHEQIKKQTDFKPFVSPPK